jgi:hypothetical protein
VEAENIFAHDISEYINAHHRLQKPHEVEA